MELWLVQDCPAWLVGVVVILGLPAVILGLDRLIHRSMTHRRLDPHNAVTGVIVSVVGVAYAVVIGFCVVSLWDGYTAAETTVRSEAVNLTALVPASAVFGEATKKQITGEIIQYESDIVTDWNKRRDNGPDAVRIAQLGRLTATVGALQPTTEPQKAFVLQAMETIGRAEQFRHASRSEASDKQMSDVMWIGVLISTASILCICLFFGLSDDFLRRILLALSSVVIATNLFLIVQMNYPYYGTFAVPPEAYVQTVDGIRPQG